MEGAVPGGIPEGVGAGEEDEEARVVGRAGNRHFETGRYGIGKR